jgi:hypothetical protein
LPIFYSGRTQVTTEPEASHSDPPGFWVERLRARLKEGGRPRRIYDRLFLPVADPVEFTEGHKELVKRLRPPEGPDAAGRAAEILAEAQATFASAEGRGEGAERRATTLQGAVAIAASVLLAGAALLGDPSTIQGEGWRLGLGALLILVTICLVAAGARALGATARIHIYHRPTPSEVLRRATMDSVEARIDLAAETFEDSAYNDQVAAWKVAYLAAAAWWFRGALFVLLALAILLGIYLATADGGPSHHTDQPVHRSPMPTSAPEERGPRR